MHQEKLWIFRFLPGPLKRVLFGDRQKYGLKIHPDDPDWLHWQQVMTQAYAETQHQGIGDRVCRMAYNVVSQVSFLDKEILEIGPGIIRHLDRMRPRPKNYTICDTSPEFLQDAEAQLNNAGIPCTKVLVDRQTPWELPFPDCRFDTVLSFFSLEHLHPLDKYLAEIKRVLRPGGRLVGGIPCEGGLAWGLGRFLFTRGEMIRHYGVNYDKIICWEHPNFADFTISRLEYHFTREYLKCYPFPPLPLDMNFVASFIYLKGLVESSAPPESGSHE